MSGYPNLKGISKWVERDEWADSFEDHYFQHLEEACAQGGIDVDDEDEVRRLIGDDDLTLIWWVALEDFMTIEFEDGANIVDVYLKRRGYKESAPTKAYLTAVRNSKMSFFEVIEADPGRSIVVRDLVEPGTPVRAQLRFASPRLREGDVIAARLLEIRSEIALSPAYLVFDQEDPGALLDDFAALEEDLLDPDLSGGLDDGDTDLFQALDRADGTVDPDDLEALSEDLALTPEDLVRVRSRLFATMWLVGRLEERLGGTLPGLDGPGGEPIELVFAHYPYLEGKGAADVRSVLRERMDFKKDSGATWAWNPLDEAPAREGRAEDAPESPLEIGRPSTSPL